MYKENSAATLSLLQMTISVKGIFLAETVGLMGVLLGECSS